MKRVKWLIPAILAGAPCAAGAQAVVTERTLAATAANEAAMAALEQCRKEGHRVTVTVLDHAGRTKVMARDDGANPHTVQHATDEKCAQAGIDRIAKGLGG